MKHCSKRTLKKPIDDEFHLDSDSSAAEGAESQCDSSIDSKKNKDCCWRCRGIYVMTRTKTIWARWTSMFKRRDAKSFPADQSLIFINWAEDDAVFFALHTCRKPEMHRDDEQSRKKDRVGRSARKKKLAAGVLVSSIYISSYHHHHYMYVQKQKPQRKKKSSTKRKKFITRIQIRTEGNKQAGVEIHLIAGRTNTYDDGKHKRRKYIYVYIELRSKIGSTKRRDLLYV